MSEDINYRLSFSNNNLASNNKFEHFASFIFYINSKILYIINFTTTYTIYIVKLKRIEVKLFINSSRLIC